MDHLGPFPKWKRVGGPGSRSYEAVDFGGVTWVLWMVEQPQGDDPIPPGYRLARRDDLSRPDHITAKRGLYSALDMAGLRIASQAVRDDPDGTPDVNSGL